MNKLSAVKIFVICLAIFSGVLFGAKETQASVDFNCYCLDGSIIPFYYPDNKKLNTSDFDSCHQECANAGAKYFSFSTVAHVGTTKVTKSSNVGTTTPPAATGSVNNGQITNDVIPGTTGADSKFVKCGRSGQRMCTLCDLIAGLNNIIQYIMKISIGVGILAFAAGGVMYILSGADPGMKGKANDTMYYAGLGFVIIFTSWLIVNTVIVSLGSYSDLGIGVTSWGQFECKAK